VTISAKHSINIRRNKVKKGKRLKLCVKNDQSIYFSKSHIVGTRDKRDEANPSNEVKDFISNNKHKFIQRI
jgi:hypothetical protein